MSELPRVPTRWLAQTILQIWRSQGYSAQELQDGGRDRLIRSMQASVAEGHWPEPVPHPTTAEWGEAFDLAVSESVQ